MTFIICRVCGTKIVKGNLDKHLRMEHNFDSDDYDEYIELEDEYDEIHSKGDRR